MDSETMSLLGISCKSNVKNSLWKKCEYGSSKGVLQKKIFWKIQQNLHESTCAEHFFKKRLRHSFFPKDFLKLKKKTFSPEDCFWKFTSSWLFSMLFKITGLKGFAKFPNKFVRALKFFYKELFFSSKNFIRNNPITGIF